MHASLNTISVALSDRLAAEHARAGQEYVSASVFGRPEAAEAGRLAVVAAESQGVPRPIASLLRDRLLTAIARGNEASDWSVLGRVAQEDAGVNLRR